MKSETDIRFMITFFSFLSFLVYLILFTDTPRELIPLTVDDLTFFIAWITGSFVAVVGACVVAPFPTGAIACPIALGGAIAIITLKYISDFIAGKFTIFSLLILVPITLTIIYILLKVARGTQA